VWRARIYTYIRDVLNDGECGVFPRPAAGESPKPQNKCGGHTTADQTADAARFCIVVAGKMGIDVGNHLLYAES
jgi:hypothetical protein